MQPGSAKLPHAETNAHIFVTIQRDMSKSDLQIPAWSVLIVDGSHNHGACYDTNVFASLRKLSADQKATISDVLNVERAPKSILATLRHQDVDCPSIMKDLCNQKAFFRNLELDGLTPIEMLLDNLHARKVLHAYQRNAEGQITHLFFVPTYSVELIQEVSYIVLIDSTYKTNRFHLPLLHMVGMKATNQSFLNAFCFMRAETEMDYPWALRQ